MKLWKMMFVVLTSTVLLAACGGSVNATIGGQVSGLSSGNSVTLTNGSNGDSLVYNYNSSSNSFTFDKTVASGNAYNVTVTAQPTGETCSVANGVGTVNSSGSNITNIVVTCNAGTGTAVPVVVSVLGLENAAVLVLADKAAGSLTITGTAATASGGTLIQNFPTSLYPGNVYSTSIVSVSAGSCAIQNGTGTGVVPSSGSPSIIVTCS